MKMFRQNLRLQTGFLLLLLTSGILTLMGCGKENTIEQLADEKSTLSALSAASVSMAQDNRPEVILDNMDEGTSHSGDFKTSVYEKGYYGANYHTSPPNAGDSWFEWVTNDLQEGTYNVYAWWTANKDRPTDVRYVIKHATGSDTVSNISQAADGGKWNFLGRYTFGTSSTVRLLAGATGYQNGSIADGIRFEPTVPVADFYTIVATASGGGTLSQTGDVVVDRGASKTFTMTPAPGYVVKEVKIDGVDKGPLTTYTFSNVQENHSIEVVFAIPPPTAVISSSAGPGGTISASGSIVVNKGESKTFTIAATAGYIIKQVKVDGADMGAISTYTFNNIQEDHTIEALFIQVFTIKASAGTGGSISDAGNTTLSKGEEKTYTVTADAGYLVSEVKIDGVNTNPALGTYTFTNIGANHVIEAIFKPIPTANKVTAYFASTSELKVTVEMTGTQKGSVQVVDLAGRILISRDVNLKPGVVTYDIPVANLKMGSYIVRILGNNLNLSYNLLKTN